jgi:hypothetical protein
VKKLSLIFLVLVLSACSNQWREGDAGLSSEKVGSYLDEAMASSSVSSFNASTMKSLRDDPNSAVFFAEAPGPLGTVASLLSLMDFSFLGTSNSKDLWWGSFPYARVFLLDTPTSSGRKAVLILGLQEGSTSDLTYHTFAGDSMISDGEYLAELYDSSGHEKLALRSFDTDGDDMKTVIQIKVSDFNLSGQEQYIGKFSTLVGYGR